MMNVKKEEKGFTLIELMIVVAIIGILAAIAIPQFASYRVKAFNAAATTDLRNAKLAEEGLYADFQFYGGTAAAGDAGTAAGVIVTSATTGGAVVATGTAGNEVPVAMSSNVSLIAKADAANGTTATITSKHLQGDRRFATDTDASPVYFDTTVAAGTAITAGIAATSADDPLAASMTVL